MKRQEKMNLNTFSERVEELRQNLGRVIVGQKETIDLLLTALFADGHVLIESAPGMAKTLMAKTLARVVDAGYNRIQFTPDLMPSDVIGTSIFNMKKSEFEFRAGPLFGQMVLIDEINRAPAKTQSALFEAMEERQITVDGQTYPLRAPFMVMATQNPIEQEGTYRLPEAQLDRFLFMIKPQYPSEAEEVDILERYAGTSNKDTLQTLPRVLTADELRDIQQTLRHLTVQRPIAEYIAHIIRDTRRHPAIFLGASPRAGLYLVYAAKVRAAMNGRDYVIPDDVKHLLSPVLEHRMILNPEKELEGITLKQTIREIADSVEVPR